MDRSDIQTLYAYNRWANLRMFSALEKLSEQQFAASRQSSFPSIRESIFHILAAEWIWLKRWKGTPPIATQPVTGVSSEVWKSLRVDGVASPQNLETVAELRSFCDALEQERQQFMSELTDARLHASLSYRDMSGKPFTQPLAELMQHVVNHGTYHRGQVTTLLRQAGAETIGLDMVYFFRERQSTAARES
ncbi:MAG TPA: DinB family protein [Bryocella sp.]|nr:DinB family protein [Bryocella sp.]